MKKKDKYWLYSFIAVLVILGVCTFLFLFLKKPGLGSIDIKIARFSGNDTLDLNIEAQLYNPNNFSFKYDSIQYFVDINKKFKAFGKIKMPGEINAESYNQLNLPLKVLLGPKNVIPGDSGLLEFHFKIFTHFHTYIIPINYTLDKKIPLYKKLITDVDSLIIKNIGFKKMDVLAAVTLSNPGMIKFHNEKISYEFFVENNLVANGDTVLEKILNPKSKISMELPLRVKSGKLIKYFYLRKKKFSDIPYRIVFHFTLLVKGKNSSTILNLEVERLGKLEELQQGMKKEAEDKVKFE